MKNRTRLTLYTALLILLVLCGRLAAQAALPGEAGGTASPPGSSARPVDGLSLSPVGATDLVPPDVGPALPLDPPALRALPWTETAVIQGRLGDRDVTKGPLAQGDPTAPDLPDLVPYAPKGWSYPVTPSSEQGTRRVNGLYAGMPTYLDWAVLNQGNGAVGTPFQVLLFVDGELAGTWQTDLLPPNWYAQIQDFAFVVTTPGWHTVRLLADPDADLAESDERNNTWEYRFYWQAKAQPNLAPTVPQGWSGAVVPSCTSNTHTANTLYVGQPTFIDWAIVNQGNVAIQARVYTELYLDDRRLATWRTDVLLPKWEAVITDWSYTVLTPGWHTLRLVTDATDAVAESDETDNVWEERFFWEGNLGPNLKPYTPPGWDAPLRITAQPGDGPGGPLYTGEPVYVDWAMVNEGGADISGRFETHLYMDGLRIAAWPSYGLPFQGASTSLDWAYMAHTPGRHTFTLVVDAAGTVAETNEEDNVWEAQVWFQEPEARTVGVEWVNNYFRAGLPPLLFNHINAGGFASELARIGWKGAFNWGNDSAWEQDFKDPSLGGVDDRVVDGVAFAYFSGHGNRDGFFFDTMEQDHQLSYSDALWGNGALNWIAVDACLVLNNDDGGAIERWGPAFAGLHMLLGFDTECYDSPYRGQNLARYANGSYWWDGALSIRDAWFHAAAITEDSNTYSAALIALEGEIDPSDDHLPDVGDYSADPREPTSFALWRVQN